MNLVYTLKIAASCFAFTVVNVLRYPRGKIPITEFLVYTPALFAVCLSVPGWTRIKKQDYVSLTQSKSTVLEIERIRQISLHLANVTYCSRAFSYLLMLYTDLGPKFSPPPIISFLLICNGIHNVLLNNISDFGVVFE